MPESRSGKNKRKLVAFIQVSLDGYFAGEDGDFSWAHKQDAEWKEFVEGNAGAGGTLLFGRITYELMASYWPTPFAAKNDPSVAERMNAMPKIVFSKTLKKAAWQNTKLAKNLVAEVRKMKATAGKGMAILGSGSIVSQLAEAGLIDEFQVVVNPIALGKGKALFNGIKKSLKLKLVKSRIFKNGSVLLNYKPAA